MGSTQHLDFSSEAQAERRGQLRSIHRESVGAVGNIDIQESSPRSRMWHATAWLVDPEADSSAIERYIVGDEQWGPCAFCPAVSMQMLVRWSDRMSPGFAVTWRITRRSISRRRLGRGSGATTIISLPCPHAAWRWRVPTSGSLPGRAGRQRFCSRQWICSGVGITSANISARPTAPSRWLCSPR